VPRDARRRRPFVLLALIAAALAACTAANPTVTAPPSIPSDAPTAAPPSTTPPFVGWSNPADVGKPYGTTVNGLLTFRGNPTRTFFGTGPAVRANPRQLWAFPRTGYMCGTTMLHGTVRTWCGNGWTGQPAVVERGGRTWLITGGYDHHIHFLDAKTGERILPDFVTNDVVKGSLTVDPDGYPLVYSGSRDGYYRIISFDGAAPKELWKLNGNTVQPRYRDDDWDSTGLVLDDYLFQNSENGNFHIIKLNRGYDAAGKATVKPQLLYHIPSWDKELQRVATDFSVENSVAIYKNIAYFANSSGLVQGWDLSGLKAGRAPTRVFRFWTGDDVDATVTVDEQGMLYIGVEYETHNERSQQVGQMLKLDPTKSGDPVVWRAFDKPGGVGGVWGTPALYKDIVIFDTNDGDVLGLDRATGQQRWRFRMARAWSSPVVVDDVLFLGDCSGNFYAYDVANTRAAPAELWGMKVGGCIESTPAVWKGVIYFADRQGKLHAIGSSSP
jgi:outer membrane protein assembly factor BamB